MQIFAYLRLSPAHSNTPHKPCYRLQICCLYKKQLCGKLQFDMLIRILQAQIKLDNHGIFSFN